MVNPLFCQLCSAISVMLLPICFVVLIDFGSSWKRIGCFWIVSSCW